MVRDFIANVIWVMTALMIALVASLAPPGMAAVVLVTVVIYIMSLRRGCG